MKDGSEVRGVLLERGADGGAKLRTLAGDVRNVPGAFVEYAGRVGTGALRIDAAAPASVRLDRAEVGRTPLALENLAPAQYRLHLEFDDGGSSDYSVVVAIGRVTAMRAPLSKKLIAAEYREGMHFVLGGGPVLGVTGEDVLFGLNVNGGFNLGLTPSIDFRCLGHLTFAGADDGASGPWYEVGASAAFRFNLSSVYSMEAGARVSILGMRTYDDGYDSGRIRSAAPGFGVQVSVLSLRLGSDRGYELTLWHSLQFTMSEDSGGALMNGISFTHVFE